MTVNGWLQIAFYFVVLTALVVPLGRFMARVFEGAAHVSHSGAAAGRNRAVSHRRRRREREQHWITYTVAMLLFNAAGFLVVYGLMRLQAFLPLNPADQSAVRLRPVLQYGGQLRHQHQLAELRRRKHAELSHADGRS